jgi:hypothetical protein
MKLASSTGWFGLASFQFPGASPATICDPDFSPAQIRSRIRRGGSFFFPPSPDVRQDAATLIFGGLWMDDSIYEDLDA